MRWLKRLLSKKYWTIVCKGLATLTGKPYFKVYLFHHQQIGTVAIDAYYNSHFIYKLDQAYKENDAKHYKMTLPDEQKVAIYMYDVLGGIAENYINIKDLYDDSDPYGEGVPPMSMHGGESVRQVVDLADNSNNSGIQIHTG